MRIRRDEYLALDDRSLAAQCDVDCYRSRGPGGQKKNKTSSAVRLRHRPTGVAVTAGEERSQNVNKRRAIRRLRRAIALNVRGTIDLDGYARSVLLESCIASDHTLCVGRRDRRYCPAVGEILDLLAACNARVREAAKHVGVSTANLVKFFQRDPKVWESVNRMRAMAGVRPLRPRAS